MGSPCSVKKMTQSSQNRQKRGSKRSVMRKKCNENELKKSSKWKFWPTLTLNCSRTNKDRDKWISPAEKWVKNIEEGIKRGVNWIGNNENRGHHRGSYLPYPIIDVPPPSPGGNRVRYTQIRFPYIYLALQNMGIFPKPARKIDTLNRIDLVS